MVRTVYVVFKVHLDLGYTDFATQVELKYFKQVLPDAMRVAQELREREPEARYCLTVSSWVLHEFLERASASERVSCERAIAAGDLAWHALPFTFHSELLDASLLQASLGFSASLDRRFGRHTTGGKMSDVPGHSIGIVRPLVDAGIEFLDVGTNGGNVNPQVPFLATEGAEPIGGRRRDFLDPDKQELLAILEERGIAGEEAWAIAEHVPVPDAEQAPIFRWREPTGRELLVLYHRGYGNTVVVPGTDVALSIRVRFDNRGAHSREQVIGAWSDLRRRFPGARLVLATLSDVGRELAKHRESFPVLSDELGDSWIFGVASDPTKLARYRALARLRRQWLDEGRWRSGDGRDLAFLSRLLRAPEHTWGLDGYDLAGHDRTYQVSSFETVRRAVPAFARNEDSWREKRRDIDLAIETLPEELRAEAAGALAELSVQRSRGLGYGPHDTGRDIIGRHWTVRVGGDGSLTRAHEHAAGREWADPEHRCAAFVYETFDQADYDRFNARFSSSFEPFVAMKHGLAAFGGGVRGEWAPTATRVGVRVQPDGLRVLVELEMPPRDVDPSGVGGWPSNLELEYWLPESRAQIGVTLRWFGKRATRHPEAMTLSFTPRLQPDAHWWLDKLGTNVAPDSVVAQGGRALHAVWTGVRAEDEGGILYVDTLDAPLVGPACRGVLQFDDLPRPAGGGMHFNLYNNVGGTNWPQWYSDDGVSRFVLRAAPADGER